MKIYTKTGDRGETGLFGGGRVSKDHPRIEAYGTVDELNSFVGLVADFDSRLKAVQNHLFDIGALLATPEGQLERLKKKSGSVGACEIDFLERWIDEVQEGLEPLKNFVLPGGSTTAARFHLCRVVCRRAERRVVSIKGAQAVDPNLLIYLNRLSDLFFVLARLANKKEGVAETAWTKNDSKEVLR